MPSPKRQLLFLQVLVFLWFAALTSACGGKKGSPPPPPPTLSELVYDSMQMNLSFTCTPPPLNIDGINLELKVGDDIFRALPQAPPYYQKSRISIPFSAPLPEGTTITLRAISIREGRKGEGFEASTMSPPNAPAKVELQWDVDKSGIAISWDRNSLVAAGVRIQRSGGMGDWIDLPVSNPGALTFLDTDVNRGTSYYYRLSNRLASYQSTWTELLSSFRAGLPAPKFVGASFDFSSKSIRLVWETGALGVFVTQIERQDGLNPWTPVATVTSGNTWQDTNITVGSIYSYRLVTIAQMEMSQEAVVSSVTAGLSQPVLFAHYDEGQAGVVVTCFNVPTEATAAVLERSIQDEVGQPNAPWTFIASITSGSGPIFDNGVAEGQTLIYRLRCTRDAFEVNAKSALVFVPLLPPLAAKANSSPGAIRLEWVNQSRAATEVLIKRDYSSLPHLAILSPGTTSFTDREVPAGFYRYWIAAAKGPNSSPWVQVETATTNGADAFPLAATPLPNARFEIAALRPNGSWLYLSTYPLRIHSMPGEPWPEYLPGPASFSTQPWIASDSTGSPHLFSVRPSPDGQGFTLFYDHFREGAWRTEAVVPFVENAQQAAYAMSPDGVPHIVIRYLTPGQKPEWRYLVRRDGQWAQEILDLGQASNDFHLSMDASGTLHLLAPSASFNLIHGTKNKNTTWNVEIVDGSYATGSHGVWRDHRNGWVFGMASSTTYPQGGYFVRELRDGVWLPPLQLGPAIFGSTSMSTLVGNYPVLATSSDPGMRLFHLDDQGWHTTLIAKESWIQGLGVDQNALLHLLTRGPGDTLVSYIQSPKPPIAKP